MNTISMDIDFVNGEQFSVTNVLSFTQTSVDLSLKLTNGAIVLIADEKIDSFSWSVNEDEELEVEDEEVEGYDGSFFWIDRFTEIS